MAQGSGSTDRAPSPARDDLLPTVLPWGIGDAVLLLAVFVLWSAFLGLVVGALLGKDNPWSYLIAVAAASVLILWLVDRQLVGWAHERRAAGRFIGLRWPAGPGAWLRVVAVAVLGIAALCSLAEAQASVVRLLGIEAEELPKQFPVQVLEETASANLALALVLLTVIVAPITEEVLFRGMLYLPLRSRLGPVVGALVACAIFSGVHVYPLGLVHLFLMALILTALFETTGSLYIPIIAHGVHNGITMALVLAARELPAAT